MTIFNFYKNMFSIILGKEDLHLQNVVPYSRVQRKKLPLLMLNLLYLE